MCNHFPLWIPCTLIKGAEKKDDTFFLPQFPPAYYSMHRNSGTIHKTVQRTILNILSPKEIFSELLFSLEKRLHIREKFVFRILFYNKV